MEAKRYGLGDPALDGLLTARPALRTVLRLVQEHRDLIRAKRPTVTKNSSGYNLFGLVDGLEQGLFDLPKLFIGSEGTLGVISEATLRLVERPRASATALIHFRHLEDVGEAVPSLLALEPSALEVMDANTLDLIGRDRHGIPSDAAATVDAARAKSRSPTMMASRPTRPRPCWWSWTRRRRVPRSASKRGALPPSAGDSGSRPIR